MKPELTPELVEPPTKALAESILRNYPDDPGGREALWADYAQRFARAWLADQERIANADAFLADPAGSPLDAINLARKALQADTPEER